MSYFKKSKKIFEEIVGKYLVKLMVDLYRIPMQYCLKYYSAVAVTTSRYTPNEGLNKSDWQKSSVFSRSWREAAPDFIDIKFIYVY